MEGLSGGGRPPDPLQRRRTPAYTPRTWTSTPARPARADHIRVKGKDQEGHRHSPDVRAKSTYGAAHLYMVEARNQAAPRLPLPTVASLALQRWISERRQEWKGPRGSFFKHRPTL